jgi:hypothetical protein
LFLTEQRGQQTQIQTFGKTQFSKTYLHHLDTNPNIKILFSFKCSSGWKGEGQTKRRPLKGCPVGCHEAIFLRESLPEELLG